MGGTWRIGPYFNAICKRNGEVGALTASVVLGFDQTCSRGQTRRYTVHVMFSAHPRLAQFCDIQAFVVIIDAAILSIDTFDHTIKMRGTRIMLG